MLPYFALFGFFAVPAVTTATKAAGARDRGLWLGALVLVLAIGLRLEVGGDWYVYLRLFRGLQTAELGTVLGNSDPAYSLVSWTVAQLGLRIWAVNLVCAAIFTYGLISLARLQPNPWLALLVSVPYLVIVVAMGYTRQSAALGLLMVALSHQVRGNPLRMIVSLLIAAAFHKSAVITIPLEPAEQIVDQLALLRGHRRSLHIVGRMITNDLGGFWIGGSGGRD